MSQELEATLNGIFQRAKEKSHEYITVEHVLAALLDNPVTARVLVVCGADIEELRKSLNSFIDQHVPKLKLDRNVGTEPTLGFQRVIQRAVLSVQSVNRKEVTSADVLVAVFGEKESHAVLFLTEQNISRFDVLNFISHGISKISGSPHQKKRLTNKREEGPASWGEHSVLNQFLTSGPPSLYGKTGKSPHRIKLFICYSHADVACLDRLLVHLRPLERDKAVACWSDKKIRPGDAWRKEIQKNLKEAAIAILLN